MSSRAEVEQHVLAAEDALRDIKGLAVSELVRIEGALDAVRGALSSLVIDAPQSDPKPVASEPVAEPAPTAVEPAPEPKPAPKTASKPKASKSS